MCMRYARTGAGCRVACHASVIMRRLRWQHEALEWKSYEQSPVPELHVWPDLQAFKVHILVALL